MLTLTASVTNNAMASPLDQNPGAVTLSGGSSYAFTAAAPGFVGGHYDGGPLASANITLSATGGTVAGALSGATINFTQSPTNGVGFPGPPAISEFNPKSTSFGGYSDAVGPDGNVWYPEYSANKIGYYTPATGANADIDVSATGYPQFVANGGDGNIWFESTYSTTNTLSSIDLAHGTPDASSVTQYSLNTLTGVTDMTEGPDGNLYIGGYDSANSYVGRFNVGNPALGLTTCQPGSGGAAVTFLAAGPDGNVWFAVENQAAPTIGYWQPGGTCPTIALNAAPHAASGLAITDVAAGADGNLWMLEFKPGSPSHTYLASYNIGSSALTECPLAMLTHNYQYIASGPDGDLYLSSGTSGANYIARVTTSCQAIETNTGLHSQPMKMVTGPLPVTPFTGNAALWFPEWNSGAIGSIQP